MKEKNKTWITEKEAAEIIQLPGKFVRKLVTAGSLKGVVNYFKSKRAAYRYNKVELENYLFENSYSDCLLV
ncbi:MAG: helix-turn-helix domain-containing protein [Ferruginibacter sp.]